MSFAFASEHLKHFFTMAHGTRDVLKCCFGYEQYFCPFALADCRAC
jgi:hypothetical protein